MSTLIQKQVCIRLSPDGTGFIYSVKHGRFVTATDEIRLFEEGATPALTDHAAVPCRVALPARSVPQKAPTGINQDKNGPKDS